MVSSTSVDTAAAAAHWDDQLRQLQTRTVVRVRWWEDETTIRHINRIVGSPNSPAVHGGFHDRIASVLRDKRDLKAISVGCGAGTKELWLSQLINVQRFDLYDISPANIEAGKVEADRQGATDRFRFYVADAFEAAGDTDYDLVYWNNALHHMSDVAMAVQWSRDRLKPGGLFAMDDFVGPDRFQWTDENMAWANRVRENLPDRLLSNPYEPGQTVSSKCGRPTVEEVIASDPSEAVDSGRILARIKSSFPAAEIIPTGGALYHLALNDIFLNFKTEDDLAHLRQILMLDEMLARSGTTQYAVAFAIK